MKHIPNGVRVTDHTHAVRLSEDDLYTDAATICAMADNVGNVFVGDADVGPTSMGFYLEPKDSIPLPPRSHISLLHNLAEVWIISENDGDGVWVAYV